MRLAAAALLATALASAAAAQDFDSVRVRSEPVAEGLHVLFGRGGNIAVVSGADGVVLIDDQYAPLHEKILAAVRAISPEPIRFVVNTHWHGDHTGGNERLGGAGAVIVAHENVRRRMSVRQVMELRGSEVPASPPGALPVVTFNASLAFHLNGMQIAVEHVPPAHTDGDAVVWFEGRDAVHLGDVYFNGLYPFIDVDSGGSVDGVIAAVDAALERIGPETRVIPGHGPLSDREGLLAYRSMLSQVRASVAAAIAAGRGIEEILAERPSARFDERWGGGFLSPERFVRLLHASLTR